MKCDRRRSTGFALIALVSATWAPAVRAVDVPEPVLAAQANRVATIERIVRPTIAIFDRQGQGGGSGVIISPDGYALTNFHVTAPCGAAMKVGLSDGRLVDAVLVGLDPGGDIALIKLLGDEGATFPVAELGDSDDVRVGDWAFVAGNPFLLADNYQPTVSYGIISGVRRYQYPAGTLLEYADCLQTDAAVNPGNSGGPLFNADGKLIGINGRCSFEKRGRVNVGVGYAVSINQIKRFVSHLKSGRLVDHASLGAIVSTDSDGRVVVDDILDDSDAYRRGLRYGDEIVRFGGREITTANTFKNVLGTYPEAWRVPLVYRRDGTEYERLVRLAPLHGEGGLVKELEGERPAEDPHERPEGPLEPPAPTPDAPKRIRAKLRDPNEVPEAVTKVYEAQSGYANHWFNEHELQRVWSAFLARGDFAGLGADWRIRGKDKQGGDVEISLNDQSGTIVMPEGKSGAQFSLSLSGELSPPRSGGLLAALHLWQRLLLVGPKQFGEVVYFGRLPWPNDKTQPDCLVGIQGGVKTRFYFDPQQGDLVGIEMQADDDQDPCEIYLSDFRPVDGRQLPFHWMIRHGDDEFAELTISDYNLAANAPSAPSPPKTESDKN
ncbi:MAG: S1C family serine protease [Pirellulales bacterium]